MDLSLSHWTSHRYLLLTLSLIHSSWNCLIQIISKLSSVVSRSSVSVVSHQKYFRQNYTVWESSCQKTLAYVSCYTSLYYQLSMYLSSRESICVSELHLRSDCCVPYSLFVMYISTRDGRTLSWVSELRYLKVYSSQKNELAKTILAV